MKCTTLALCMLVGCVVHVLLLRPLVVECQVCCSNFTVHCMFMDRNDCPQETDKTLLEARTTDMCIQEDSKLQVAAIFSSVNDSVCESIRSSLITMCRLHGSNINHAHFYVCIPNGPLENIINLKFDEWDVNAQNLQPNDCTIQIQPKYNHNITTNNVCSQSVATEPATVETTTTEVTTDDPATTMTTMEVTTDNPTTTMTTMEATTDNPTTTMTTMEITTIMTTAVEGPTIIEGLNASTTELSGQDASRILLQYDLLSLMYREGTYVIKPGNISLQIINIDDTKPAIVISRHTEDNSITIPFQIINATGAERLASFLYQDLQLPDELEGYSNTSLGSAIITAGLVCNDSFCNVSSYRLPKDNPVEIELKHEELDNETVVLCVFWDFFRSPNGTLMGKWNTSGCKLNEENSTSKVAICECNHLSHFAILLSSIAIPANHAVSLQVIGYVGITISLIALSTTALIFICFKPLWSMRNYIHINLCFSLMTSQLVFVVAVDKTGNVDICSFIAVLLQYLFLVTFMWMLMEGVVLYVVLVKVFVSESNKRAYVIAFTIISYGLPLLYMVIVVPLGFLLDGTRHYYYELEGTNACWLRYDTHFIWSFNVPVMLIILCNIGFYIMAIAVLWKQHGKSQVVKSKRQSVIQWIKSAITLTVVMGLTWIIGILQFHKSLLPVSYVFTIAVAFQGLAIFVVLIILSKQVRLVFIRWMRDKVNESSFLSSRFGDKLGTLMSQSRKDTNGSQIFQRDMGYKLGTFGECPPQSTNTFTNPMAENSTLRSSTLKSTAVSNFEDSVVKDDSKGKWAEDNATTESKAQSGSFEPLFQNPTYDIVSGVAVN